MAPQKPFESLILPRKTLAVEGNQYRVYKADGSTAMVNANTVQEAIKASGVETVLKVERALLSSMQVVDAALFRKDAPVAAQPTT